MKNERLHVKALEFGILFIFSTFIYYSNSNLYVYVYMYGYRYLHVYVCVCAYLSIFPSLYLSIYLK